MEPYLKHVPNLEPVFGGRLRFSIYGIAGIGGGPGSIVQPEICNGSVSLAGIVIGDGKDGIVTFLQTGGVGNQAQSSLVVVRDHLGLQTNPRIVNQSGQTGLHLPIGFFGVYGKLKFIVHVINGNIKGVGILGQMHPDIGKKVSQVFLRGGQRLYFKLIFRRFTAFGYGSDKGSGSNIPVRGIGALLAEQTILLQPA